MYMTLAEDLKIKKKIKNILTKLLLLKKKSICLNNYY